MERLKGIYDVLVGNPALPKSFRNVLVKYGDMPIVSAVIKRTPLTKGVEALLNAATLGKWNEIKGSIDRLYHLYMVLILEGGKRLLLEKNERPVLSETIPSDTKETESTAVTTMTSPILLSEFIGKTIKRLSLQDYISYDGFSTNCQHFIRAHLLANGLLDPENMAFVYQDIKKLVERTPSFSKWLAKKATDVVGTGRQLVEELVYKRGGLVAGRGRSRGKRFGL
jgi:hypothetical protein